MAGPGRTKGRTLGDAQVQVALCPGQGWWRGWVLTMVYTNMQMLEERAMSAEAQEAILTLEVSIGLVVQLAVGYQLLHAGETLSAAQG